MKEPHCTLCDRTGHYKAFCTFTYPSGRKPNNGKYSKKWFTVKNRWRKANPPNHEGYYECYICHKWILAADMTIDHILPRSHAPELRYEFSNLASSCWPCNSAKGSKHLSTIK